MSSVLALILQLLGIIVSAGGVAVSVGVLRGPTVRAQQLAASISNFQALREAQSQEPSPSEARNQRVPRCLNDEDVEVARKEVRLAVATIKAARSGKDSWVLLSVGIVTAAGALLLLYLSDKGLTLTTSGFTSLDWVSLLLVAVSLGAMCLILYRRWVARKAVEALERP